MRYFRTLPKIASNDYSGNQILLTNLMVRTTITPSLFNNPLLFYTYDIQDGDTPESIAEKYYGDPYRYWIVLFANQTIDPQWNWPMNSNLFQDYLVNKYTNPAANALSIPANTITNLQVLAYTQNTIKNYTQTVTTTDSLSGQSNTTIYMIDSTAYANVATGTIIGYLPSGSSVTQSTTKGTMSIFNYELQQNENNRTINLVDKYYVSQFESQFKSLVS